MAQIRVGPIASGSYVYRVGNRISEARYANAESAWADAERPQKVNARGNLEPDVDVSAFDGEWDGETPTY